jgi:hypothetical protein
MFKVKLEFVAKYYSHDFLVFLPHILPSKSHSVVVRALVVVAGSLPPAVYLLLLAILTLFVFVVLTLFLPLLRTLVPVSRLLLKTILVSRFVEVVAD